MPISQSRMLSLIQTADSFKAELFLLTSTISSTIQELPPAPTLAQTLECIQTIQTAIASSRLDPKALDNLASERAHFRANASRNTRMALKAKIKRGQNLEEIPSRTTAPLQINAKISPLTKHLQAKPLPAPPTLLPDSELPDFVLANHKIEINKFYSDRNCAEPYPDPYDDSTPLSLDHKIHLNLEPDGDGGIF